ncbi:AMP-binding protein [Saccharopolyspora sp. K220]|uniref:AMP-binding protein n=1 Tax=Saccharopolyspora soli TaxID=2926618 RepID=UPI001F569221|nr:AMP-binding protein [Saccharopolyspora soli]MCI2420035.1 AMP-binding protein [Saccharopolyspora soli]
MIGNAVAASATTTHNELVLAALRRWPDRSAFVYGEVTYTYAESADLIARMMAVLAARGIGPGTALGVLAPNRPEAWLVSVAAQLLGGHSVGMHARASFDDHLFECVDADVRVLVVDPTFADDAGRLAAAGVSTLLSIGPGEFAPDILALAAAESPRPLDASDVDGEHWAEILYTGGTTGRSKGVIQSQRARAAITLAAPLAYELPLAPVYLAAAPITHAAAHFLVPTLLRGGTVVLLDGFRPEEFVETVRRTRANFSFLVPTMIYKLLDHGQAASIEMPTLERIIYGASPMSPSRLIEGHDRLGPVFTQIYGQTETLALGTALLSAEHDLSDQTRLMSCGRAVPGTRIALLGEDNRPVARGEVGEIAIRSPGVMLGYHHQPELTAETLADGWLHTGDMGREDDAGFYTIVDRKKDFIISGGFNVYTREIEDVLCADPAVAAAAVIGIPDPVWGEAVKAVVVPVPGATVDIANLVKLVRDAKGGVHTPKSVDVVAELPLTPVGKPDKKALRAAYWADQQRAVS